MWNYAGPRSSCDEPRYVRPYDDKHSNNNIKKETETDIPTQHDSCRCLVPSYMAALETTHVLRRVVEPPCWVPQSSLYVTAI